MSTHTLAQTILLLKPTLSKGSASTYASLLRSLRSKFYFEFTRESICKNANDLIKEIEFNWHDKPKVAKQLYSALLVFDQGFQSPHACFDHFRSLIKLHNKKDTENEEKQELTSNQKEAWMTWTDIVMRREELGNEVAHLWNKEAFLLEDLLKLQDYVIACVYTMMAPRRLLDFVMMRTAPPSTIKDNGVIRRDGKLYFAFQVYKTAATHGQQIIPVSDQLAPILENWLAVNPSPYLFFNTELGRMGSTRVLQRRLAKIFRKNGFGVNILRHAFISDNFLKDTPFVSQIKEVATSLGHSMSETMLYKKHI